MAATKTVTKLTTTDAIVRVVATAASDESTIDLSTDLKMTNETLGADQSVIITGVLASTSSSVKLTRNSVVVGDFHGNTQTVEAEWSIIDQPTQDIVVTFAGAGTIILHLKKIAGYNTPFETASFGSYDNPNAVGS